MQSIPGSNHQKPQHLNIGASGLRLRLKHNKHAWHNHSGCQHASLASSNASDPSTTYCPILVQMQSAQSCTPVFGLSCRTFGLGINSAAVIKAAQPTNEYGRSVGKNAAHCPIWSWHLYNANYRRYANLRRKLGHIWQLGHIWHFWSFHMMIVV